MNADEELTLHGNPKILIVDDEELMREVASIMIEDHGGDVLTAVDGKNAVEVFESNKDSINCVIMDFSMPQLNGYEAIVEIRKISDTVPCIMVSGLAITPEVDTLVQAGELIFMSKPFHEETLIETINGLLGEG